MQPQTVEMIQHCSRITQFFLLVINNNIGPLLRRCGDIATYRPKIESIRFPFGCDRSYC